MVAFISFFFAALACLLMLPVATFLIEVVASVTLRQKDGSIPSGGRGEWRVAVLVPAHNESTGLLPTIVDIKAQLLASDRLLVVADNCTDDTASVAAAAGAEVVVRDDVYRKGKGYALSFGLDRLGTNPPDIVVVIDSDCRLADGTIDRLVAACVKERRPVQALNLMIGPPGSPINYQVAEFAWRVKNWVRPLGLRALGLPCQLMGTGMAFQWDIIRTIDLADPSIVEDMKFGLDLALSGHPPAFCPLLGVTSYFPTSVEGIRSQRLRWERGHVGMIATVAPRLIFAAILRRNLHLLVMALDLAVPPLSMLGLLTVGMFVLATLSTSFGFSSASMIVSATTLMAFVCAALISWLNFGRDILPPRAFPLIAAYVIRKIPIYGRLLCRKAGSNWIRTDRRKP